MRSTFWTVLLVQSTHLKHLIAGGGEPGVRIEKGAVTEKQQRLAISGTRLRCKNLVLWLARRRRRGLGQRRDPAEERATIRIDLLFDLVFDEKPLGDMMIVKRLEKSEKDD